MEDVQVPSLLDPPSDEALTLFRTVLGARAGTDGGWPVWQYVVLKLDAERLDAYEVLRGLPTWNYNYRSVWIQGAGPGSDPELEHEARLTLHGLVHVGGPAADYSIRAFLAALAEADRTQAAIWPSATEVVPVSVDGTEFTALVNHRAGTNLREDQLFDLLQHEPATWGGLRSSDGTWSWDLTRARLHPYRGADTGKAYLTALEGLVGIPALNAAPRALSPLELSDAFDHLDLAWRLHTRERLVNVPRASVVARLTQPVSSRDEFDSRCSALSDLLSCLTVSVGHGQTGDSKPLQRLEVALPAMTGAAGPGAVDAVSVLRKVAGVRASLQHTGSADRYDRAWTALGLPRFGSDWTSAWRQVQVVTINALTAIREALVSTLPQK
jgi:hypothetical protein